MPMPNRHIQDANGYRYAYQGQEKDPETGKEAFELRLWDGRIGRWLTTDPYGQHFSPYLGMGNNPISSIDPDGGANCGGAGQPPCPDGGWEIDLDEVVIGGSNGGNSIDPRGFDFDFPTWTSSFGGNLADWNVANGTNFTDHYAAYDYWSNQQMQSAQKDFLADITRRNEAWKPLYMGIADLMTLGVGAGSGQLMNAGKLLGRGASIASRRAVLHGTKIHPFLYKFSEKTLRFGHGQLDAGHRATAFLHKEIIMKGSFGIRRTDFSFIFNHTTKQGQNFSVIINPKTRRVFHQAPGHIKYIKFF